MAEDTTWHGKPYTILKKIGTNKESTPRCSVCEWMVSPKFLTELKDTASPPWIEYACLSWCQEFRTIPEYQLKRKQQYNYLNLCHLVSIMVEVVLFLSLTNVCLFSTESPLVSSLTIFCQIWRNWSVHLPRFMPTKIYFFISFGTKFHFRSKSTFKWITPLQHKFKRRRRR
jgi:hypothetical protein